MTDVMIVLDFVLGAVAVAAGGYFVLRGRGWLALLVLAGGSLLAAAVLLMTDVHIGRLVSVEAGVVLAGWGAIMLTTTGHRHWLQVAPLVLGAVVIVLSFTIPVPG